MARSRILKPEFWSDEKLALVPREARLTFAGLWTCSDDYGVTKGHPAWLKSQIFPYDVDLPLEEFGVWLADLERIGVIDPFTANWETFFYIRNFSDHQRVDRPSKMRNPPSPADLLASHSLPSRESAAMKQKQKQKYKLLRRRPMTIDRRRSSGSRRTRPIFPPPTLVAASLNLRRGYRVPQQRTFGWRRPIYSRPKRVAAGLDLGRE